MAHIYPLQILIASLAGLINRRQAEVLEYLIEENRVLREQFKGRALRLTDDQRRRLAAKGKKIGRRLLMQVATIVTPDTILRWHNRLIRAKWTFPAKRVGRPGLMKEIRALIVRFAKENCGWGYTRIEGALRNVGHRVAPTTIRNVLKANGIKPAPDRPTSWRTFLKTHWDQIAATLGVGLIDAYYEFLRIVADEVEIAFTAEDDVVDELRGLANIVDRKRTVIEDTNLDIGRMAEAG